MSTAVLQELSSRVRGQVVFDEPLARYTTYRIGGPAGALVKPQGVEDVSEVMRFCAESGTQWVVLGLGSNVLISDRGFQGLVVRIGRGMDVVEREAGSASWRVGAGLPTPRLARQTARAGMAGVHRLIGVPGTVGGGVFMNAGAHGQEFRDCVRSVELVDAHGSAHTMSGADIAWQYRSSGLQGIVTAAALELAPADPDDLFAEIRRHFRWRREGTPFDRPCCGSVFRNPGGSETRTAGQLISAAGLKGFQVGGAQVSTKHANYIINAGNATAADVLAVIDAVRERVLVEFRVELQLEVQVIQ